MKTTRETPSFTCKVLTGLQATSTSKVRSSDLMIRDISPPRAARALRALCTLVHFGLPADRACAPQAQHAAKVGRAGP